jgi:hypothetical protein
MILLSSFYSLSVSHWSVDLPAKELTLFLFSVRQIWTKKEKEQGGRA